MAHWLVKQEPTSYSYAHLERDQVTRWDGVHNALALRYLRAMGPGDEALFYHSGDERACVGILRVDSRPAPDPKDPRGSWFVKVRPVRRLGRPVTLAEIRADPAFAGFELLRFSRLSVMPVPDRYWSRILRLSADPPPTAIPKGRAPAGARSTRRTGARRTR